MKDEHRDPKEGHRPPDEGEVDVRERGARRREEDSDWRSTAPEDPAFFIKDPG
jgi:hypothetical protein